MYLQTITIIFFIISCFPIPICLFFRTFARAKILFELFYRLMNDKIRHSGVIDSIAGGKVRVRILQQSACAACKVASHCHASETKEKLVDVSCDSVDAYRPGQEVLVTASRQVAFRATLLAFIVPLIILMVVLVVAIRATGSEAVAALSALGALMLWYSLLWLLRSMISSQVSFQIEEVKN